MNCQRFEQVVTDLARSQMMEADLRMEALAHSEKCEHCLARLRDEETLSRGLQLLAKEKESLAAPDGIELKLREAFRSRQVVVPIAKTSSRSRYWLVAVAAALLVAMSVVAVWWRSDAPQKTIADTTPPQPAEVRIEQDEPAPKRVESIATNQTPKRQTPKSVRRNPVTRRAPETPLANHEIATDFVALGDMNASSLQDGGQIVRVTLRRSALVRFGIPVNMDRYNENVKADVLIGVDGLARAIRFVQ
ncbi:MAG TPA: hypothetical protein VFO72_01355 [Pyrinomonadaceae bacterium]|nr:hypothetical protein [Pyrinomonadaceae bacterium]